MDFFSDFLAGLLELVVRLLYGIIRLIIWVIGALLSQTWLVHHFKGMRRFGWWLALGMSAYLLFGILRAMVPAFWTPALSPIYQWQMVIGALVLLLVGIAMRELDQTNYGVTKPRAAIEPDTPAQSAPVSPPPVQTPQDGPVQTISTVHSSGIVAIIVLLALIVGGLSAFTSKRHEATLAENLCAQANARISDGVEQRVRDGAGLLDRMLGTQTADKIPCAND